MKTVFQLSALLGVFIYSCHGGSTSCGCAPGRQGPAGAQGLPGLKGERGDLGETGVPGVEGPVGRQGAKGAEPNDWEYLYPGAQGPPGIPGRCDCTPQQLNQGGFYNQPIGGVGGGGIYNPQQPFKAGTYYISDHRGYLNYVGNQYPEQYLQRRTTTTTTTSTTTARPPMYSQGVHGMTSGLYLLGSNGVLVPFTNAQAFDLFAKIAGRASTSSTTSPTTTTTTTTTTRSPSYARSEKIYILGPKGSLIPLDALGLTQPADLGIPPVRLASSYNKWLRGMLMGEMLPDYDDDVVTNAPDPSNAPSASNSVEEVDIETISIN